MRRTDGRFRLFAPTQSTGEIRSPAARLGLQLPINGDRLKVLGFYDELGRVDLQQRKTPAEISTWASRLQAALPPVGTGSQVHRDQIRVQSSVP